MILIFVNKLEKKNFSIFANLSLMLVYVDPDSFIEVEKQKIKWKNCPLVK